MHRDRPVTDFQLFRISATLLNLADVIRTSTHARAHAHTRTRRKVRTYKNVRNGKSDLAYEFRILDYPLLT